MRSARTAVLVIFVLVWLLCPTAVNVWGQTTRGTILGTVTDPTGAVIPDAKVTVTQLVTGFAYTVTTDAEGYYLVPALLPGRYSVQAEKTGFQTKVIQPIELNVAARVQVNVPLELRAVEEKVVVTSEGPLVEATTAALGQVIRSEPIVDLPLNGRNFLQLALLSAGSVPLAQSSLNAGWFKPSVNISGGRESSNQYTIDGVFNNITTWEGLNLVLSVDAIQEFKVQRNTFSAEFGQGTAEVNVASKSGTNELHGTVYEFIRNDVLDARMFFDAEVPPFRQNQFGFSLGGPIIKEKTFFFVNYEGFRWRRANTIVATLPTAKQLSGDFSGEPPLRDPLTGASFPGNTIPLNRFSALTRRILPLLPSLAVGGVNNYRIAPHAKDDIDQFTIRIDHRFGDKDSLFARYSLMDRRLYLVGIVKLSGAEVPFRAQNAGVQWTHTFSPRVLNDLRVGFNRFFNNTIQEGAYGEDILRFQNTVKDPVTFGLPVIGITGFSGFGSGFTYPDQVGANTFQLDESLTLIPRSHALKFGVDFRFLQYPHTTGLFTRGIFSFAGFVTGNPVADFLLGHPFVSIGGGLLPTALMGIREFNWFVQDDWRVTPRFTLNLGLRYERSGVITDKYRGRMPVFDEVTGQFVRGKDVDRLGLVIPDNNNYGPRFGFAWQPFEKPHTVIRGGYGIYYDVKCVNEKNLGLGAELQWQQIIDFFPLFGLPPSVQWDTLFPPGPGAGTASLTDDPRARTAYVQQYSLSIQRELPANLLVEAAYAGSVGRKLDVALDINQARLPAFPGEPLEPRRPYPAFGAISMSKNLAVSSYNAFQLKVEKRFSHNLYFLAAYTFSKSLDSASSAWEGPENRQNLRHQYGLSTFDQRHRFVLSYLYQMPFGRGQEYLNAIGRVANALIGGWQLNGIVAFASGNPFTVLTGQDRSLTGVNAQYANLVGPNNGNLPPSQRTVERWFNTAAFELAPLGTFGNSGRNIVIGPGTNNFDFSLLKNIRITETKTLQFRAEFFNAFNHPQFLLPVADPTSAAFGQILAARPAREIQFGLKFVF